MRRRSLALGSLIGIATLAVAVTGAPADDGMRAELYGERIPLSHVGNYHCHDGAGLVIRCFHTEAEAAEDARSLGLIVE